MKKLLTFIVALVMSLGLAVGLTACGNKEGSTTGGGGGEDVVLTLTRETLFPGLSGTSYATYNGSHTVGSYTVTTTDVLGNTTLGGTNEDFSVMQFKKSSGVLSVAGTFKKIVLVVESSYSYDSTKVMSIYAGSTKLTGNLTDTKDTGLKNTNSSGSYAVSLFTIEFTVTGTGSQTISLKNETGNAIYLSEIQFKA